MQEKNWQNWHNKKQKKLDKKEWKFFRLKTELWRIAFEIPNLKDLNV